MPCNVISSSSVYQVDQDDNTLKENIGTRSFFNLMLLLMLLEWIFKLLLQLWRWICCALLDVRSTKRGVTKQDESLVVVCLDSFFSLTFLFYLVEIVKNKEWNPIKSLRCCCHCEVRNVFGSNVLKQTKWYRKADRHSYVGSFCEFCHQNHLYDLIHRHGQMNLLIRYFILHMMSFDW